MFPQYVLYTIYKKSLRGSILLKGVFFILYVRSGLPLRIIIISNV